MTRKGELGCCNGDGPCLGCWEATPGETGQRCKHCGANTPYTDWTECEDCAIERRKREEQEQLDAEENERLLLREYYRDQT